MMFAMRLMHRRLNMGWKGWKHEEAFEPGIRKTMEWYLDGSINLEYVVQQALDGVAQVFPIFEQLISYGSC